MLHVEGQRDREDQEERAEPEQGVREADEQLGRERHFAAERLQQGLQARQQEEDEEDDHAHRHETDEDRVGHRAGQLTAEFVLLREVRDEALQDVADIARGFTRSDQVERLAVEDLRVATHRDGEALAFAELGPDAGAENAESGFLEAKGEEAERFARGHPGADEVGHCFQER